MCPRLNVDHTISGQGTAVSKGIDSFISLLLILIIVWLGVIPENFTFVS